MKNFKSFNGFLLLLLTAALMSMSTDNKTYEGGWLDSIEEAKTLAKEKQLPILVVFSGSDWCRPCIMQHTRVFDSETFQNYAKENLVLLQVDFPKKKENLLSEEQQAHNGAIAEKFNPQGYFPTNVLIDAEENEIGRFGFMSSPDQYIAQIESKIKK